MYTVGPHLHQMGVDVCLFFDYICLSLLLFLLFNPPTSFPSLLPSIRLSLLPSLPPTHLVSLSSSTYPSLPPPPRSSSLPHLVPTFFVDYSAPSLHLYGGGSLEALESPPLGPQPVTEIHFHCIEFEEIAPWLSKLAHSYHNLTVRRISRALL